MAWDFSQAWAELQEEEILKSIALETQNKM